MLREPSIKRLGGCNALLQDALYGSYATAAIPEQWKVKVTRDSG
jgi:hypothetical protein